jgi:23S rRNA (pseudouridine1915-N3)-methyltransferase
LKFRLIAVGKPGDGDSVALHDRYAERMRTLGVAWTATWVREVRPGAQYSDAHVRERESIELLRAAGENGIKIALDPAGELITTQDLAGRLPSWGARNAAFLVGGSLGHHPTLLAGSAWVWSLSPLTFPHEITRALVAEQIYRALTIVRGLPYHK